jgi:hypothetical protein
MNFLLQFFFKSPNFVQNYFWRENITRIYMLFIICNGPMKKCFLLSRNLCWDARHYGSSQVFQKVNINDSQLNFHNVS